MVKTPAPDNRLRQIIIDEIKTSGPMPLDRYMQLCLTHPQYGYYIKQDPLGPAGDFITSPEITQIFGEILSVWCIGRWERAGKPEKCAIIELGPGRGTLMGDLLRVIKNIPDFKPQVHLVEISPGLEAAQRHKLQDHDVTWHKRFPRLNLPAIVIANEFFDALPIKQFVGDKERMIIADGNKLAFNMPAEEGTVSEICPIGREIMVDISENAMAGAIIDYGYEKGKKADSLQAVYRHKYAPALESPGDADLSAHVDFAALINSSKKSASLYTQREFLLGQGADLRAKILNKEADLARLTAPGGMGELFKVLCF